LKTISYSLAAFAALLISSGCSRDSEPTAEAVSQQVAEPRTSGTAPARPANAGVEAGALRLVVDRSERALYVHRGAEVVRTHPVAIGKPEHQTPSGSWRIYKIDLNPEWIPPDSDWARDRERKAPGDPNNPMGRARLIFDPPYSIHGTEALDSLGSAASHGSIRVANPVVVELARLLLQAGGGWEGEAWFQERLNQRTEMTEITLDRPVEIEVRP